MMEGGSLIHMMIIQSDEGRIFTQSRGEFQVCVFSCRFEFRKAVFSPMLSGDFLFLYQSTLALRAYPWRASTASVQHFLHLKRISNLDTTCMLYVCCKCIYKRNVTIFCYPSINKVELSKMVISWNNKFGCTTWYFSALARCHNAHSVKTVNWLNGQNKY